MKFLVAILGSDPQNVTVLATDDDGKLVDANTGEKVHQMNRPYLGRNLKRQVAEFEKWLYKNATPGELLTYWDVAPVVDGGQVTGLVYEEEHDGEHYEKHLEDWQYELLGVDPQNLGSVEAHPEGSDRGGYVPTLTNDCHYDENGGCWQG